MNEKELDTILFLLNDDNRLVLWIYYHVIEPYIVKPILIPILEKLTIFVQWLIDHT